MEEQATVKSERKAIFGNLEDVLVQMAEGNHGAVTVLSMILKAQPEVGFMIVLHLDDMNIRGSQIWIAFKDYCGQDINKLIECARTRDPAMVAVVNQHYPQEVAVTAGASSLKR